MCVFEHCLDLCRGKPGVVVYPDGEDPRVVQAGLRLQSNNLAVPLLLGRPMVIRGVQQSLGTGGTLWSMDHTLPLQAEHTAAEYQQMQRAAGKVVSDEQAAEAARSPLVAGALMLRRGDAELGIAGNISSTADVLRAGLRIIGRQEQGGTVSSFFFMIAPGGQTLYIFTDGAVIPEPTAIQLAHIATGAGRVLETLMGVPARVALLSFSTKNSAEHPRVQVVRDAVEEARRIAPDMCLDGELQFDAAIAPEVAAQKAPGSPVAGRANVFVFPSLDAGNISYKVAQRLCGFTALGPFLQGLAGGWHDLSRGCSADDVYKITVVGFGLRRGNQQAQRTSKGESQWMLSA